MSKSNYIYVMSKLPNHTCEVCDDIDATVFTGDLFYRDPEALKEFEMYLARWQRGINSIKEFLQENPAADDQSNEDEE